MVSQRFEPGRLEKALFSRRLVNKYIVLNRVLVLRKLQGNCPARPSPMATQPDTTSNQPTIRRMRRCTSSLTNRNRPNKASPDSNNTAPRIKLNTRR